MERCFFIGELLQCVGDEEYGPGDKDEVVRGGGGTGCGDGLFDVLKGVAMYTQITGCRLEIGYWEPAGDGGLGEVPGE